MPLFFRLGVIVIHLSARLDRHDHLFQDTFAPLYRIIPLPPLFCMMAASNFRPVCYLPDLPVLLLSLLIVLPATLLLSHTFRCYRTGEIAVITLLYDLRFLSENSGN